MLCLCYWTNLIFKISGSLSLHLSLKGVTFRL